MSADDLTDEPLPLDAAQAAREALAAAKRQAEAAKAQEEVDEAAAPPSSPPRSQRPSRRTGPPARRPGPPRRPQGQAKLPAPKRRPAPPSKPPQRSTASERRPATRPSAESSAQRRPSAESGVRRRPSAESSARLTRPSTQSSSGMRRPPAESKSPGKGDSKPAGQAERQPTSTPPGKKRASGGVQRVYKRAGGSPKTQAPSPPSQKTVRPGKPAARTPPERNEAAARRRATAADAMARLQRKQPPSTQPGAKAPERQPAAKAPERPTRKRLRRFSELGYESPGEQGLDALAIDVGAESLCLSEFNGGFTNVQDLAQPTMALVKDPHAFRSLEPFSLEFGLPALERWPARNVLRGTDGSLKLASQIGLVEFPADHVVAGAIAKALKQRQRTPRQLVLTLPTFLASRRGEWIREQVAPRRKGGFRGAPAPVAAAYFYLSPALQGVDQGDHSLMAWSHAALASGRLLVLDWGAGGLEYGLVSAKQGKASKPTELRLELAGVWPSLGGHRLTYTIVQKLKDMLIDAILEAGPSDDLVPRPLLVPGQGMVPRPPNYEYAFDRLRAIGEGPHPQEHVELERRWLRDVLLPTAWRYAPGEEPPGFAPYRRLAIAHFKALWKGAERLKRLILGDPKRYRRQGTIPWPLADLDSPYVSHLELRAVPYPVEHFQTLLVKRLQVAMRHLEKRLRARGLGKDGERTFVAACGMQSCTPLLERAVGAIGKESRTVALREAWVAPSSSDPLELKSVVNRGAAQLARDRRQLDLGPPVDVLPFNVQIADCLGNVSIFAAGPIDELAVFQRRVRVEEGFPQFEFYLYESEDGTQAGSWGAIDFNTPFEFTERDRVFAVDPRYNFGAELPKLRDLKGDQGKALSRRCFDRSTPGWTDGLISFRRYAPRGSAMARRLLHFLEYGLTGEFYRKVYLLEREFLPPPKRFDYVYQRYYLSRSQELLVVREWWSPRDGKLVRNKTLHTCQGNTGANRILNLEWGTL